MEYKYDGTGEFEGLILESMLPKEDWKYGTEILVYSNQPERSKREDTQMRIISLIGNEINQRQDNCISDVMRCSEHCGDTVREVR